MKLDITELVNGLVERTVLPIIDAEVKKSRLRIDDWIWSAVKGKIKKELAEVMVSITIEKAGDSFTVFSRQD